MLARIDRDHWFVIEIEMMKFPQSQKIFFFERHVAIELYDEETKAIMNHDPNGMSLFHP
jgi:hypothetical protein